jgi:small-conductance mechanosensitive channel
LELLLKSEVTDAGGQAAKSLEQLQQEWMQYISNPAIWTNLCFILLKMVIIVAVARLVIKIANKGLHHTLVERENNPLKLDKRRTRTIGKLIGNIITYVVNFIMILMLLVQLGINMGPILASAGVVGLAIGFGAQSLVKDVITGFFIIFEDQFAVGDAIQINNFKGNVEEIGLRVTKIRSGNGELYIIPNGTISQVTNFSVYNSVANIDVSISHEENVDKAVQILRDVVKDRVGVIDNLVKEPTVLGVQKLGPTEIVLRITAECRPNAQGEVTRILNAEIKKAFDANGIEIPYPRIVQLHKTERAEDESWRRSSSS